MIEESCKPSEPWRGAHSLRGSSQSRRRLKPGSNPLAFSACRFRKGG